ncbi:hypothetical protein [Rhodophyticola sp. CCM32]|nr:hypothetical protein [Rhodophyticola sp. CCM32]
MSDTILIVGWCVVPSCGFATAEAGRDTLCDGWQDVSRRAIWQGEL